MKTIAIEIKWAILFSIMVLVWMVLENLAGLHDQYIDLHLYLTNLFAVPAILVMVLALKDKRKSDFRGELTYLQGLKSGVILSLLIAVLSPLTQWITSYVITPEYFPNVIQRSLELGKYDSIEEAEAFFNYNNYAIQGIIGALIMGIATTAIAMIFLKSKKLKSHEYRS
jgi:hypothetical protein